MDEVCSQASVCINNKYSVAPAKKFAAMLMGRKASIISAGKYGNSSGQLEEAKSKSKVLKRTAYGYRRSSTSR